MKFRGDSDYKMSFELAATRLIDVKIEDRTERIDAVQKLIDEYVTEIGERPDACILEKLADYILREELLDKNPYKVAHDEYPFLSEKQMKLRHGRECKLEVAENCGSDGKRHDIPIRRRNTKKEQRAVDKAVHRKKRKESAEYRRDSTPGVVISYNLREVYK